MIAKIIMLECITNMHVGNGDVNYNIVDNEVERDPVTNYPTINSSGVKGALREYFDNEPELKGDVNKIFGSDESGESTQGKVKILAADMLSMPVRAAKGKQAYYHIATRESIGRFQLQCETFLGKKENLKAIKIDQSQDVGAMAENINLDDGYEYLGKKIYLAKEEEFRALSLPVMARNKLENGKSQNLWYEEVVPHGSVFYFPVVANDTDEKCFAKLIEAIKGKVIQFGGNATIGYGLCKVSVLGE